MDIAGTQAKKNTTRKPITLSLLDKVIRAACWALHRYDASLMRVVFSLAFHACACIGETVSSNGQPQRAVMAQNMVIKEGQVLVTITSFKHHRGASPEMRVLQAASSDVCPATLLCEYACLKPGKWSGPLVIWKSGIQVAAKEVRRALHQCLQLVGIDTSGISPHSFQISSVLEAAQKGASEAQLRMMGRWKSNAYMRYIRPTQLMPPQ